MTEAHRHVQGEVALVTSFHVVPSDEVTITPFPTATKRESLHVMLVKSAVVPDFLFVHFCPSEEVASTPFIPTVTNFVLLQITERQG